MPLSFSNFGAITIIFMVLCLTISEVVKYLKREFHHSKK